MAVRWFGRLPCRGSLGLAQSRRWLATHASEKEVGAPSLKQKIQRGNYAKLSQDHVKTLKSFLSSDNALISTLDGSSSDDLLPYNQDWMNKYKGKSQCVVRPKTVEEVSQILAYCNKEKIAVVPQGGNTGLVGGSVPVFDEIVINLGSLNKIRSFDEMMGVLICDSGCILEVLDNFLKEKGYMMPLDLGAKGSCQIGGNVSTNAGGLRLLRYGSLHGTVLGIEAVLPSGEILNTLSPLRKDNTGFDLKQLFIGSEGTIGIITGISILTPRRSLATNVALLGLDSFDQVKKAFTKAKTGLNEILSAFEFWDKDAMQVVEWHHGPDGIKGLEGKHNFYCLVETSGSNAEHDSEKLSSFLEDILETEIVQDGVLAQDESQVQSLWSIREGIPEACGKLGSVYKYDMSIPIDRYYDFIQETRERLEKQGKIASRQDEKEDGKPIRKVVGYGHIGDCNVHLNIVADTYDPSIDALIEPFVYEWVAKENGSISAEHGLGLMKAPYLPLSKSKETIDLMRRLKALFDPNEILMPYKFLPASNQGSDRLVQADEVENQEQGQVAGH